ncbi:beta carbonic anhydrase, clade B [Candidatus Campylobacter infans]|uniref:carbonic anhydrase n=1 Tax=Candidatus Campylobacter infans TaxID=2561898 RepID=A0A7H9CG32_9BACT|nr:carbonic anhydrase [Candidatus Campylobacter infans]QLI04932.1 beta carbonic anhydrase, clade B [Candidatus Campylobacter infans]
MSIIEGAIKFMHSGFSEYKELFKNLSKSQNPHTLFIGCSDSRVVPSLITSTLPGELFVVRNIANIVPKYRLKDEYLASTSAIVYAIMSLKVENIVICGHSDCNGCAAIYDDKKLQNMPSVARWLEQLNEVKNEILNSNSSADERGWLTERLCVLQSMENIRTYPQVNEREKNGLLRIYGWHYIIQTGEVYSYENEEFILLNKGRK